MTTAPSRSDAFYGALFEDDPAELYENAPCGYLSVLPDGTIVKVNETFLRWTGFTREELLGTRRLQELLRVGDRIYYETHFAPLLRLQGSVREIAVDVRTADGSALPLLVNAVTKVDDAGEPLVVRVAVFDARERRAYEQELVEARNRAEASEAQARALAQTLQASFLPPEPPHIPGLQIAAVYRPAGDGTEVGGDFYDVFELRDGTWGIALGDVCGKGAAAAAVTALVRYTIRAAATTTTSPAETLGIAHEAMLRQRPDTFCTAVYVTVDMTGPPTATIALAGHPPPVLRRVDATPERVGITGSILGMLPAHDAHEVVVPLAAHDALVLFTDGIVEARRQDEFFGVDRLLDVIRTAGSDAHAIATALADAAVEFQYGNTRDDIAVVVLGAPPR